MAVGTRPVMATDFGRPPGPNPTPRPVMAKNLYVGNMAFSTTEERLREVFSQYGTVTKVQVIMDRETGRPRGFAFVEMSDGADQAVAAAAAGTAAAVAAAAGRAAAAGTAAGTVAAAVAAGAATNRLPNRSRFE